MIVGIDEAGRGPLAGPVSAAAVVLPPDFPVGCLADSKALSPAKREAAARQIRETALAFAVADCSAARIDAVNILQATLEAMQAAFEGLHLPPGSPLHIWVDGNRLPKLNLSPYPNATVAALVKGDTRIPEIMAASILAKTHRDALMTALARRYPQWEWEQNKGYPTPRHLSLCRQYGRSPVHRHSFHIEGLDP